MSPQQIAVAFAERLGRHRALTQEETDMLQLVIEKRSPYWTGSEVETVRRMRAAGKRAPTINEQLNNLGMEGWEIVHLQQVVIPPKVMGAMPSPFLSCIFKREKMQTVTSSGRPAIPPRALMYPS